MAASLTSPGCRDASLQKPYAFSQFAKAMSFSKELQRQEPWDVCTKCQHGDIVVMGYSVRDDRWRYTEWAGWDNVSLTPAWNVSWGVELYDHDQDYGSDFDKVTLASNRRVAAFPGRPMVAAWRPGVCSVAHCSLALNSSQATATVNLAQRPQYASVVKRLSQVVRKAFNNDHEAPQST